MATNLSNRNDVLGSPHVGRRHETYKGAYVDGGTDVSPADLTKMVADADASLRSIRPINDEVGLSKAASAGIPIGNKAAISRGMAETQAKFSEQLSKLGMDPDIAKEVVIFGSGTGISGWDGTNGPWLYDLEAPSKKIFPVVTPLRNKIPRQPGVGVSRKVRRIMGITGSQTGGVANARISTNESVRTSFPTSSGLSLMRPAKIAWNTDTINVIYKLQGVSDDLTWTANFQARGYEDLRALVGLNLMRAHMMGEEQLILAGRSTALAAPTFTTANLSARTAGSGANATTGETTITGVTTAVYVKVTAIGHFGESVLSAAATQAWAAGQVIDVTVNTLPTGAHGFRVYASQGGADPGDASRWKQVWNSGPITGKDYTGGNVFTLSGAILGSGVAASTITVDTSASADDYDGIMTQVAANQPTGIGGRLNGPLTLDSIQKNIFYPGWDKLQADYDEVWVNALESVRITDLTLGAAGTPYRVNVSESTPGDLTSGYRVSRLMNKTTGKLVDVSVSSYLEQGNLLALSYTLPFANTEVSSVWEMTMVQDLLQVDWPVIQMTYDSSTYTFGALVGYAPSYNACLQAIQAA